MTTEQDEITSLILAFMDTPEEELEGIKQWAMLRHTGSKSQQKQRECQQAADHRDKLDEAEKNDDERDGNQPAACGADIPLQASCSPVSKKEAGNEQAGNHRHEIECQ